jgi:hypothetical protein
LHEARSPKLHLCCIKISEETKKKGWGAEQGGQEAQELVNPTQEVTEQQSLHEGLLPSTVQDVHCSPPGCHSYHCLCEWFRHREKSEQLRAPLKAPLQTALGN